MCGIVGFSGKNNFDKSIIGTLLVMNAYERGKDATGIYTPSTGIIKDNIEARKFIPNNFNNIKEDSLLLAHVRQKTSGANTSDNAHPFINNGIVLLHNGTLTGVWNLAKEAGLQYAVSKVDSEYLCDGIAKYLNPYILTKFTGAAAVLFTDSTNLAENVLYVYRNKERPLFYGYIGEDMYISSIEDSLSIVGCSAITSFEEDYLYSIVDGKHTNMVKIENSNNTTASGTSCSTSGIPTVTDLSKVDKDEFNEVWVNCDTKPTHANLIYQDVVEKGKAYYSCGVYKDSTNAVFLRIYDDFGQWTLVPKVMFSYTIPKQSLGDFLVADTRIYIPKAINKPEKTVALKGDVLKIIAELPKANLEVFNTRTNSTFTMQRDLSGPATTDELILIKTGVVNVHTKELLTFSSNTENFKEVEEELYNILKALYTKPLTQSVEEVTKSLRSIQNFLEINDKILENKQNAESYNH